MVNWWGNHGETWKMKDTSSRNGREWCNTHLLATVLAALTLTACESRWYSNMLLSSSKKHYKEPMCFRRQQPTTRFLLQLAVTG